MFRMILSQPLAKVLRLIQSYFVIVHKEFKLMVLCLILIVCCVGVSQGSVLVQMQFFFTSTWWNQGVFEANVRVCG